MIPCADTEGDVSKKSSIASPIKAKTKIKKKGVGYTAGRGEQWDINAYLKTKGAKNK